MALSTKTRAQHVTTVRRLIRETSANEFDDADIYPWLNYAIEEIWSILEDIEEMGYTASTSTPVAVVSGQEQYDLPAGYKRFTACQYYDGSQWVDLDHVPLGSKDNPTQGADPPSSWTMLKDSVLLTPYPSTNRSSALRFRGFEDAPTLAATGGSGLPAFTDEAVGLRAAEFLVGIEEREGTLYSFLRRQAQSAYARIRRESARRTNESLDMEPGLLP